MHGPGDIRVEQRDDPKIIEPTDAIIRVTAACVCGSDLWPYRGVGAVGHQPMGHEYVGIVDEIGPAGRLRRAWHRLVHRRRRGNRPGQDSRRRRRRRGRIAGCARRQATQRAADHRHVAPRPFVGHAMIVDGAQTAQLKAASFGLHVWRQHLMARSPRSGRASRCRTPIVRCTAVSRKVEKGSPWHSTTTT